MVSQVNVLGPPVASYIRGDQDRSLVVHVYGDGFEKLCLVRKGSLHASDVNSRYVWILKQSLIIALQKQARSVRLLDVVSAISGTGMSIVEADIDGDFCVKTKKWQFLITDHENRKLDYVQISSLMFTLSHMFGTDHYRAPDQHM